MLTRIKNFVEQERASLGNIKRDETGLVEFDYSFMQQHLLARLRSFSAAAVLSSTVMMLSLRIARPDGIIVEMGRKGTWLRWTSRSLTAKGRSDG
jgi:hypothetical protein